MLLALAEKQKKLSSFPPLKQSIPLLVSIPTAPSLYSGVAVEAIRSSHRCVEGMT
jgi:hypothetical protein